MNAQEQGPFQRKAYFTENFECPKNRSPHIAFLMPNPLYNELLIHFIYSNGLQLAL